MEDLTGKTFGNLTVLYKNGHNESNRVVWRCKCNCGSDKEIDVATYDLTHGIIRSCGCSRKKPHKDLTGQTINGFKILEYVGKSRWKCLCPICGQETIKPHNSLLSGRAKSCGNCNTQIVDMKGKKYGELTGIELHECDGGKAFWKFRCDCGRIVIAMGKEVRTGKVKTCGMHKKASPNRKDLTGQTFGRLKVLKYSKTDTSGNALWICECSCDEHTIVIVNSKRLLNGTTKSCGCLKHEPKHEDITGQRFGYLEALEFDHTDDQKVTFWRFKCHNCGNENFVTRTSGVKGGSVTSCGCVNIAHKGSQAENEIKDFIRNLGRKNIIKGRRILNGKEIDIYDDEFKIGIEYNGSPHHATLNNVFENKPKLYHRDKFLAAKEMGIHLISIFDVDWSKNKEKIKNYLSYLFTDKTKLYARKCDVRKLDNDNACSFVDRYHLQGSNKATMKINYGLFYNDELVAVMSFGKYRLQQDREDEYELHRYCVKDNMTILGGANKLLKEFEKEYTPKLILSYSDNDYFIGGIYEKLGFTYIEQSRPRYYWYLNGEEIKREACQLKRLEVKYPELLKEAIETNASNKEDYVMLQVGACKVYRSGNTKWIKYYGGDNNVEA